MVRDCLGDRVAFYGSVPVTDADARLNGRERGASEVTAGSGHLLPDLAQELSANMLGQILSGVDQPASPGNPAVRARLQEVARQYADHGFSEDPVLRQMVGAVIVDLRGLSPAVVQEIATSVSRTLFDDAASREQAEHVWAQLQRESRHAS